MMEPPKAPHRLEPSEAYRPARGFLKSGQEALAAAMSIHCEGGEMP